ncbi:putative reverse transcriptase domain-containing protein, partial [Tanacetum coccineum]
IMSSAKSVVTYTSVYTDSEPGRAFWGADDKEVSEGGIPRVIVLGYDGLPIQPVAPPSPNYIPGPEDPQTPPVPQDEDEHEPMFVQAQDPDYMPEPIYPEYIPLEDEHEFLAEEQPLPPVDSPTSESPDTVTESVSEEPVIPPPATDITIGARITIRPQASISLPPEAEVERLLAMTTPSPSPPISLSPPSAGERLARCMAPPAHSSPLLPSSGCPTQIQTLRISSTQALIDAVTAALPSPPLPPLPPSLYIPPPVDRRDDIPESEQPPQAENASLRARNKTTEAIEKITRNRERQAREKMERRTSKELKALVFNSIDDNIESIRTLGSEAYTMTWEGLKKKMTDKYCPQGEIQKLEIELWNLKVKGNGVPSYIQRFQELTLICTQYCTNETEKVDKYISRLPDNIYGNVKSSQTQDVR